jgi:hypothetical protein
MEGLSTFPGSILKAKGELVAFAIPMITCWVNHGLLPLMLNLMGN